MSLRSEILLSWLRIVLLGCLGIVLLPWWWVTLLIGILIRQVWMIPPRSVVVVNEHMPQGG
jgi:hypothetical protein